jgi:hypothetical protein
MATRSPVSGFLLGLILPLLGAVLVYFLLFRSALSFEQFTNVLLREPRQAAKVLSLAILPNMLALMYFNRRKATEMVRGLMAINVIWIVLFILQRFVWN